MLMQTAEIPASTHIFMHEHTLEWHGRVWEGCTTGHARATMGLAWAATGQVCATTDTKLALMGNASHDNGHAIF